MKKVILIIACVSAAVLAGCASNSPPASFDPITFYEQLTSYSSIISGRIGQLQYYQDSTKQCSQFIEPLSDYISYYGLQQAQTPGDYDQYTSGSQYDIETKALAGSMAGLMKLFKDSGFLGVAAEKGLTPAIMFDIDNTIEFTSYPDVDIVGTGPAIVPVLDFAKSYCFKDGVDCYFITARPCENARATSSVAWLKSNLGLTQEQVDRFGFIMGSVNIDKAITSCVYGSSKTTYKDVIRRILKDQRKLLWLMSVGDQLSDNYGNYSGVKVLVPNQFFQNNIVYNQYLSVPPDTAQSCALVTVAAPTEQCIADLLAKNVMDKVTFSYCLSCPADPTVRPLPKGCW